MTDSVVRRGPIAPTPRGVQRPPSLHDRIARSCLIVTGLVQTSADLRRQLVVTEVLKGDPADVPELQELSVPPFPIGDQQIVIMVARDRNGKLRTIADPRTVEPDVVSAILTAMTQPTVARAAATPRSDP